MVVRKAISSMYEEIRKFAFQVGSFGGHARQRLECFLICLQEVRPLLFESKQQHVENLTTNGHSSTPSDWGTGEF